MIKDDISFPEEKITTILAIDDQRENLLTYEGILNDKLPDCAIITTTSPKEGIKIAKEKLPDVILLDIQMPEIDGYEVCNTLKDSLATRSIPIIMISAVEISSKSKVKALETGADAFIPKPLEPVELIAQIKVMLRIKRAEDKIRQEKQKFEEKYTSASTTLKKERESFDLLHHISSDGIIYADRKLVVTGINKSFTDITGLTPDDVIGKRTISLATKFLKGKSLKAVLNIIESIFTSKSKGSFELNYNNKILLIPVVHLKKK